MSNPGNDNGHLKRPVPPVQEKEITKPRPSKRRIRRDDPITLANKLKKEYLLRIKKNDPIKSFQKIIEFIREQHKGHFCTVDYECLVKVHYVLSHMVVTDMKLVPEYRGGEASFNVCNRDTISLVGLCSLVRSAIEHLRLPALKQITDLLYQHLSRATTTQEREVLQKKCDAIVALLN